MVDKPKSLIWKAKDIFCVFYTLPAFGIDRYVRRRPRSHLGDGKVLEEQSNFPWCSLRWSKRRRGSQSHWRKSSYCYQSWSSAFQRHSNLEGLPNSKWPISQRNPSHSRLVVWKSHDSLCTLFNHFQNRFYHKTLHAFLAMIFFAQS